MVDRLVAYSRFRSCFETVDDAGVLYTVDDTPFAYQALADNGTYQVKGGETWPEIADAVYAALPYGWHLWWVIMDFQPTPYLDPTVPPTAGTVLVYPSAAVVQAKILSAARRRLA
jgi:hypothetical protein